MVRTLDVGEAGRTSTRHEGAIEKRRSVWLRCFASWPTNDEVPIGAPRREAQQDWLETCQRVSVLQCPLLLSIAAAMEYVLANKAPNLGLT
jgi:hypothetical protein